MHRPLLLALTLCLNSTLAGAAPAESNQDADLGRLRKLIEASPRAQQADDVAYLQDQIWYAASHVSNQALAGALDAPNTFYEQGWLELLQAYRDDAIAHWRSLWYTHPAALSGFAEQLQRIRNIPEPPTLHRLAVLVSRDADPTIDGAVQAVLRGMQDELTDHQRDGFDTPELITLDIDSQTRSPEQTLQQLQADFIIGPLQPGPTERWTPALQKMIRQGTPVLLLNRSASLNPRLPPPWQINLSSEAAVRKVLRRATDNGSTRLLLIASNDSWAKPLIDLSRRTALLMGAELVATLGFEDTANLHDRLSQLLLLDQSRQRSTALAQLLDHPLVSEPQPRQDIDAILLIARPEQARAIVPLVNYLTAASGGLPLYATPQAYDAGAAVESLADLEGMEFCDLPVALKAEAATTGRQATQHFHALGTDAVRLSWQLRELQQEPTQRLQGATGALRVAVDGRVVHDPDCYRIQSARLKRLPD